MRSTYEVSLVMIMKAVLPDTAAIPPRQVPLYVVRNMTE